MDKLRLDFFDIIGYLIPGTALLFSLWVTADSEVLGFADLYAFALKINANTLLSGLVVSYVMGFTLHFLGSYIFRKRYGKHKKKRDAVATDLSLYWALVRQHGEKHLPILDRWQALKALASNLAAYSLIAIVLCLVKWWRSDSTDWLWLVLVFAPLFFAYSNRAKVFSDYLDDDSFAVFETLNLKEKLPQKTDVKETP